MKDYLNVQSDSFGKLLDCEVRQLFLGPQARVIRLSRIMTRHLPRTFVCLFLQCQNANYVN